MENQTVSQLLTSDVKGPSELEKANQLLKEASEEIKRLRPANEKMGARLLVFDQMMYAFNFARRDNYGVEANGYDVCYKIERHLTVLKQQENAGKQVELG